MTAGRRMGASLLAAVALGVAVVVLAAGRAHAAESITVYSGQHEQTVAALVKDFQRRTGITVKLRSGGEGELANQILQEGSASPADVFYAGNPPAIEALGLRKLLAPVTASTLAKVPRADSSPRRDWVGVSARASVLAYNTAALKPSQLPASILDLAKPRWKGKVGFSPAETDFQPIVTAVTALKGKAAAESWLKGLKANGRVYEDNEAIIAAVNRGEIATGLVEHYYWYRLRDEIGTSKIRSAIHYFGPRDPGALVAVSGAGVLRTSDHQAAAQKFLAYLVSPAGQRIIVTSDSYEYPLVKGVPNVKKLKPLSQLKPPAVSIAALGDGRASLRMLQDVGLL